MLADIQAFDPYLNALWAVSEARKQFDETHVVSERKALLDKLFKAEDALTATVNEYVAIQIASVYRLTLGEQAHG